MKKIQPILSIICGIVIIFTLTSCCPTWSQSAQKSRYDLFVEQTTLVKVMTKAEVVKCEQSKGSSKICKSILKEFPPLSLRSSGTGTFIDYRKQVHVLTVAHVCEKEPIPEVMSIDGVTLYVEIKHTITVVRGNFKTNATIIKMDKKNDLCLLSIDKEPKNVTLPKIASKDPTRGSYVSYAGAPYGMISGTYLVTFSGTFAGYIGDGFGFSLPCAPGTSGSSIRNEKGEIVSIVQRVIPSFKHMCYGGSTKSINKFLNY